MFGFSLSCSFCILQAPVFEYFYVCDALGNGGPGQRYFPTADCSILVWRFLACKAYSEGAMFPGAM